MTSLAHALSALPHGREFRFLDRLLSLVPGKHGTGEYFVRGDEPFLQGHFPGQPLMPGVLLIEAGAQLAGTVAQSEPGPARGGRLMLTAIRAAKILGTARPGEKILLEARILGRLSNLIQAQITVTHADHVICQAEVTLSSQPDTGLKSSPPPETQK